MKGIVENRIFFLAIITSWNANSIGYNSHKLPAVANDFTIAERKQLLAFFNCKCRENTLIMAVSVSAQVDTREITDVNPFLTNRFAHRSPFGEFNFIFGTWKNSLFYGSFFFGTPLTCNKSRVALSHLEEQYCVSLSNKESTRLILVEAPTGETF